LSWFYSNAKLLVIGLVVVVALAFLLLQSTQATMVYYITVSEFNASGDVGTVRVVGRVADEPVLLDGPDIRMGFTIEEGGQELPVVVEGSVPDALRPGTEAVVEGQLSADGVFQASQVMATCPSKYESELK
jgi:cytochrome c-type biogenesis protein CcmE